MASDAISNVPLSTFSNGSFPDKMGGRRMTSVKQNNLDVRIEPWLSQVKNKGWKLEMDGACVPPPSFEGQRTEENIPAKTTRGDDHHQILGMLDTEGMPWMSKDFSGSVSSCCSGSCSSSTCEEDDWEAIADALAASTISRSSPTNMMNTRPLKTVDAAINHRYQGKNKAWTPDDVFRPRSLPSLSKLQKKPTRDSGRSLSWRPTVMTWQRVVPPQAPSPCPICCEDFDVTDANFHPCPCGFQLCLFCHKKILEVDSRCPGCRKQYDLANPGGESLPFPVTRSDGRKKRF